MDISITQPAEVAGVNISTLLTSSCSIDESYKYIFLPLCYSFTFIFSLSLNSVVLHRSFCHTRRWNTSLIYMVNLASTDLMYGLSLPFLVASYIMRDRWVFGDFMCRLVRFLFYFNLYCSIFFLTCISVHRYLGICHPMRIVTMESKRAVKGTCAIVWAVVFVLTSPIFRFAQTGYVVRAGQGNQGAVNAGEPETFLNCWDDAIDEEFSEYVPYGIILHVLGFFIPFVVIAWCYSHVVLTIFRTLHQTPQVEQGVAGIESNGRQERMSVAAGKSPYVHRRRKSIKTIVTITILFSLCFLPFHITRTLFLVLKELKNVHCYNMRMVSICYKVTRPLASFNAWLNALLYFLTKDKGPPCCPRPDPSHHRDLLWPLRTLGRTGDGDEVGGAEPIPDKENESKSTRICLEEFEGKQ
ncbi:P2Y purinoceptor 3-like [Brienomyrus brachyistius]|uniref:P2Y purinoceptor 3-like n=1 Tax=Brienomyrus brachyistius TaxID=42636 RepID=UPI0020B23B4E|nr:P2Y purinoceptor 3-like [Brienomyrus brachyistius]